MLSMTCVVAPSVIIVHMKEGTPGEIRDSKFHLTPEYTFRQLQANVLRLMKQDGSAQNYAFQDKVGGEQGGDGHRFSARMASPIPMTRPS